MLTHLYEEEGLPLKTAFGGSYPATFVHPVAEYLALTRHVGLIDLTHWRTLRVTGADRVSFLQAMLTADIGSAAVHEGCHSLMTTIKGKIIAELFVFVREDDVVVFVAQGDAAETRAILEKHIIMEDVAVEDISSHFGVLALEGAGKVEDVLWRIFSVGPFPKSPLQAHARAFGDVPVYLMANSVTGEEGCHLMIPAKHLDTFRRYLVQACRGSDGLPVGLVAWNMRRVENGLPWYGIDFDSDNLPDEVRLGRAVSYSKGCFRGQETLARLHHRGHVNWQLVGLTTGGEDDGEPLGEFRSAFASGIQHFDEMGLTKEAANAAEALDLSYRIPPGADVLAAGGGMESKGVGRITSTVFSPALGRPLALGSLRYETVAERPPLRVGHTVLNLIDLPINTDD